MSASKQEVVLVYTYRLLRLATNIILDRLHHAQFALNLNNLYDRFTNTHFHNNRTSCLKSLINNNCYVLYHNNSTKINQLPPLGHDFMHECF